MNQDNASKLREGFPFLEPIYFECGDGWFQLIWDLCEAIEPLAPAAFAAVQVKEKFGGLRFYAGAVSKEVYKLIDGAEEKSFTICEQCGETGKVRYGGWVRTLCDGCAQ